MSKPCQRWKELRDDGEIRKERMVEIDSISGEKIDKNEMRKRDKQKKK